MSILHHFGQVKRKYEPYVSPIPAFDCLVIRQGIYTEQQRPNVVLDSTTKDSILKSGSFEQIQFLTKHIIKESFRFSGPSKLSISSNKYTLTHDSHMAFTNLSETFSNCLAVVREKIENALWKTIDCCPFVNIMDLLILKHADTDSHIEHLEQLIIGLIDDNKTLQTKINSLEQQMTLFKKKEEKEREKSIPIAYPLTDSVAEQVLFDLD
jgi:hypothetical protein